MKKINVRYIVILISFFTIFLPIVSFAAGLVLCGNPDQPACNFSYAVDMINEMVKWIISMATTIFIISAIYGGFLYMTSGENPGNKAKAKGILWNTLLGFVIILTAWLIVYTILINLAPDNETIFKFLK